MAIAIARPLWPGGTLDSLPSSRSVVYGHDLQISSNACTRPCLQKPHYFVSYSKLNIKNLEQSHSGNAEHLSRSSGKTAIQRIAEKLRSLGYVDEVKEEPNLGPGSAGEIFIPHPKSLPKYRVGYTIDRSWSTPEHPVPEPGQGTAQPPSFRNKQGENPEDKKKREVLPTLAELTIPEKELKRLRTLGIRTDRKLKVGKAGISEGIVDSIHERWRNSEVVKIKCDDICRMNMKRTHDILERKTGGLVVWRAGSVIILYRGINYEPPYVKAAKSLGVYLNPRGMPSEAGTGSISRELDGVDKNMVENTTDGDDLLRMVDGNNVVGSSIDSNIEVQKTDCVQAPGETEYDTEINEILDGLGPRYVDWWGYEPLPVDADLLPTVVPGYTKPFRLLPYGMKPKLTNMEMTMLRRLGRPLPSHFALGRNYQLQGLAAAMLKLWEKSEIAKIAVKRGVQNTSSEKMAEELKRLTGGTLLSRDREFIVFYRGKDFLPLAFATTLAKRKAMADALQEKGRKEQLKSSPAIQVEGEVGPHVPGTVEQSPETKDQWEKWVHSEEQRKIKAENSRARWAAMARRLDSKLAATLEKKIEVENDLAEVEKVLKSSEPPADQEMITDEERFMLRKLGLRLKSFLLLGRRGVFDGVVENMHLHWKYRELVKIISKERSVAQVHDTARMLEYESGGILVAVERVSKGHAIIIYRGKNYRRPSELRPKGLLNKRAALKRSIDIQRRESLGLHILRLERNIERLKSHLSQVGDDKEQTTEQLTDELYSTHPSEDDKERNNLHSIEEVASVYPSEDSEIVNGEENLQSYAGKSESKDKYEMFQSTKNVSQSVRYKAGAGEHSDKKNKMLDPIFRAEPLSNKERLVLRKQALKMKKTAQLQVGKSNVVSGLAKSIRLFLQKHAFVKVGVKGRAEGTSIAEIVFQLEEATGAVLVSQEPSKVILYRGWPEGQEKPLYNEENPLYDNKKEDVSPELMKAMRKECGLEVEVDKENAEHDAEDSDHVVNKCLHMNKEQEQHNFVRNFEDYLMENREIDKECTVQSDSAADSVDNNEMDKEDTTHFEPYLMDFQGNLMENHVIDGTQTACCEPCDDRIVKGERVMQSMEAGV